MRKLSIGVLTAVLLTASAASADVQLIMSDGRVSIVAKDATLRQILAEWARVGQTQVVNIERIPGGPLTLELNDIPEGQALDVLLRPLSGYLAAPRQTQVDGLSVYDRIVVMPVIAPPRAASAPPPPAFQQPQLAPGAPQSSEDDADRAATPSVQAARRATQIVNELLQSQGVGRNGSVGTPAAAPNAAGVPATSGAKFGPEVGTSAPGMMTRPAQPGQGAPSGGRGGPPGQ